MREVVYNAIIDYYSALEKMGYLPYSHAEKLLVLSFYKDFVENDYRGIISRDDYAFLEKALDCLFGSSCLIPYPDYMKSGKLNIGSITEIASRIKNLEETEVLKLTDVTPSEESDVIIISEES